MNRNGARREYQVYLASPHWRSLAARIKLARGNKCERCGETERLDAHHLTYDRIGCERDEDLMVLCRECHLSLHESRPVVNWAYAELEPYQIVEFVPDYEEGMEYNERQLGYLADKMLILNPDSDRPVLFSDRLRSRKRREILTDRGVPDPSIVSGLYWRTHPQGRAWWNYEERQEDDNRGFYREASAERVIPRNHPYVPEPFKPLVEKGGSQFDLQSDPDDATLDLEPIAQRYIAGETLKSLAAECGLTSNTLYYRLRKHYGVGPRKRAL
jgi:hypothetical protein